MLKDQTRVRNPWAPLIVRSHTTITLESSLRNTYIIYVLLYIYLFIYEYIIYDNWLIYVVILKKE